MLTWRERLLFGLVYPVLILVAALLVVMQLPSGAAAAEFASLGVMLGAIVFAPVLLIGNGVLAWTANGTRRECFIRGMILPCLVVATALGYQLGLLDLIL